MKRMTRHLLVPLAYLLTIVAPFGAGNADTSGPARLINISARLQVQTADNVMIAGFIITGSLPKKVIIRGLGPSLVGFGIFGVLTDPLLELHKPDGSVVINDNWEATQASEIQATGIAPVNNLESAMVVTLTPGAYTAILRGADNGVGIGLVDVYDLDEAATSAVGNVSIRGSVENGENIMIAGVITAGDESLPLILRALGPSLGAAGVSGSLPDPTLELYDANGLLIASNDDWKASQQAEIEASGFAPQNDRESALVIMLPPGLYTAIVRGKNGQTGVALAEVYKGQPTSYSHIFVIVMENVGYENVIGSENAPYINNTLLPQAVLYTNSFAVSHPSLPNYLALFAGSTFSVTNDNCIDDIPPNGPFDAPNVYSELKNVGNTALAYMEDLPFDAYPGCQSGLYVQRHNPFMYFNAGTTNNVPYSASVVYDGPYSSAATWPDLTFISPNLVNDMHDGATVAIKVSNGDAWLSQHLPPLISYAKAQNGLIILTMDENTLSENQHIPTILIGDRIAGGQIATQTITHYNVTKTITDNFGAPAIGNSLGLSDLVPLP
jgi:phosphoesterase family protein